VDWSLLAHEGVQGVFLNFHPSAGDRVFSSGDGLLVFGDPVVQDERGFYYGPQSFQQLLPELYSQALNLAQEFLQPDSSSLVVDLYCGTGSSLKRWVSAGASAFGVELSSEAIDCAKKNIESDRLEVLKGRCEHRLPQIQSWLSAQESLAHGSLRRLLFVNPPRSGLETSVLSWITSSYKPKRWAYLSCAPGSLARDLEVATRFGYRICLLQPYDFFPRTAHVETLALLERETA
jgi:tRNA/tmRNA/rRNA uracil-C5-methylase (TrmA/RlmC/RlmD family)